MVLSTIENFLKYLNYNKLSVRSMYAFFFGLIFLGLVFPRILKFAVKSQLRVTPGTKTRAMFEKVPFALDFKIYLFNVTNKDDVMTGAKPILQEIGPYFFDEYKYKENIVDDEENDAIEYDFVNSFIFRADKSGEGLTGEEIITVVHPMILSMILTLKVDREELLPFIVNAINGIFRHPTDPFYTGPAKDLLFDGIVLDCSSEAYEVSAVCSELDSEDYAQVQRINETAFKFSLFGNTNGTSIGRFKAKRGKENIEDLGRVIQFNGESEMDYWEGDKCNQIHGTDGTIFPPFHKKTDDYWVFAPPICRSLQMRRQSKAKYSNIRTQRFTVDFDSAHTEDPKCWCRSEDHCPLAGTFDLFPCAGVPMTVTLPHFLEADPTIVEKFESGLKADKEAHQFRIDYYQYAGAPLSAAGRLQFNFEVVTVDTVPIMGKMQEMYLPFLWLEEGTDLNKELTNIIKFQLALVRKLVKYLKWLCIFGGVVGILLAAAANYFQMDDEKVIAVEPETKTKIENIEAVVDANGQNNH